MNNETLNNFAESLATETGIDTASASKVISWLISEGILDAPVVNETFNEAA